MEPEDCGATTTGALCGLGIGLNAMTIVPLYVPRSETALDEHVPPLRIVALNVRRRNRQFTEVAKYLERQQADLILLEEVDQAWLDAMASGLSEFQLVAGAPHVHNFGIALLIRKRHESGPIVIDHAEVRDITAGIAEVEVVEVRLRWHRRPVSLLGIHTIPPASEQGAHARDVELAAVAEWAIAEQAAGSATVVMGDFNATPWSHVFRRTLQGGKLLDSEVGFGVQPSWHCNFPPALGIPIDHCLHSPDLRTTRRLVDADELGSDHRPLVASLQWIAR